MLKFLFALIPFLSFLTISAQQITNIQVTQEGDKVVITYDISSNNAGQTFDIKVECSTDGGKTFSILPKALTGDLKGIKAGSGKEIVWDVLSERQELAGDQFVFQLVTTNISNTGTFTDLRDGHIYKWIKIGTQVWMAENLKTTKYNDGTSIQNVTDNKAWVNLKTPGYCWYNNDITNKNTYGALYNWYTINTDKLAPKGWHVPTDAEWTMLTTYLGGESIAGGKLKETGTTHWISPNIGATNEIDFTALPCGYRDDDGAFGSIGNLGYWWSSSEGRSSYAWYWRMSYKFSNVYRYNYSKKFGFSVRCVKD